MRLTSIAYICLISFGVLSATAFAQTGPTGGIYDKPYLGGESPVKVGGYIDMEYEYVAPADAATRDANTFDQHRLIPFLFAEITPDLHFSTEIEFEHGGNVEKGGEVNVEYLVVDYRFVDALQFRTGIILTPLGRFNLVHDSPVNDLTDRPLVDQQIIPTTLSEAGAGFFGTLFPSQLSVLNYEVYLLNGFNAGLIRSDSSVRIRDGRGSVKEDNNQNKALAARFNFSPRLGLDLGLSTHVGKYDSSGESWLTIVAFDAAYRYGALELSGELAQAGIERKHLGLGRQTQRGYVLQGNYHFLQDWLKVGSTFTGVVRYDWVDYGVKGSPDERISRLTFGVNFRPIEKAVFKTDFQTNWSKQPGAETLRDNYRIFASVAAYF